MALLRMFMVVIATVCVCNLPSSEACTCRRRPNILLQDLFCRSEYVIEVTAVSDEIIRPTEDTPDNPYSLPWEIRRYTVNTSTVYKTSPNYEALENKNFISTLRLLGCGVWLKEDVKYVIFGDLGTQEEIYISRCDYRVFPLDRLNADQLRGLKYAYKDNCDQCKIDYCREMGGCDNQTVSQETCVVDQGDAAFLCFYQHAVCKAQLTRRGRQCLWDDLGMGKFDSCLNNLTEEA